MPSMSSIKQEDGLLYEVEASDEKASEEAWEDINSCGSGGGGSGGEDLS